MFDLFRLGAEWWLVGLLLVLLLGPVLFYLAGPWTFRRQEILEGITTSGVQRYFLTFYPGLRNGVPTFAEFYNTRFGRRRYILPIVTLAAVGATASAWTIGTVLVWTGIRPSTDGTLDAVSVAALSGAYLWVVADLMARWRFRDLSPADLWWSSWRVVLSVPLAFSVGAMFAADLAVPIAFLLGAFPTRSISTIARRFARRALGLGADGDEKAESELEKLQGIDTRTAERFADEGVTTIVQLAYADPVELTMRCASFTFSFVVDCTSQALAWLYLGDQLAQLRVYSLRGAQEIASLIAELDGEDDYEQRIARQTLTSAAQLVGVGVVALERTLREIAADPYTEFICAVWAASIRPAQP